ncbi:MAG: cls [Myxococcaceae bacterium]|nr:cls [Myxococcaceae bacterium]
MKINRPTTGELRQTQLPAAKPAAAPAATQSAKPAAAGWAAKGASTRAAGPAAPVAQSRPAPAITAFDTPSFNATLDRTTGSRNTTGNKLTMLFDGAKSFPERNKMIDGAKESINLQTFIFASDDTGWDLANRLAAKAKEGVKVRVIYDGMGSNRADPKMFEMMKAAGVEVKPYAKPVDQPWNLNDRWHEKHLIVDGKASIEGGMNIANEYAFGGSGKMVFSRGKTATEPWRDADMKLEGPAVHDTQGAFIKNWETVGGKISPEEKARLLPPISPSVDGAKVRVVQHRPDQEADANTTNLYRQAIDTATKSITIENAYFLPPKELRDALVRAAHRGVEVKVMTNSRASNDTGVVSDAARYFYDDLIKAGVKVFEKQGATVHSKTATFDGAFSLVGSANLNGRSDGRDSEDVLAVRDDAVASQLEARFASGISQTKPVTTKELKNEGFLTNLKQWALSSLAWTF